MNPSKKNKLYNKYLEGDISQEEMHELNQYALDDDFLFDAIEGAVDFEESNQSAIQDLHSRLEAKRKNKRPLLLWFSAAAAAAILIVAGNFINPLQNELAQQVVMQEELLPSETELDEEDNIQANDAGMASSPQKSDESIKISQHAEVASTSITKDKESEAPEPAVATLAQTSNSKVEAEEISAIPSKIEQDVAVADEAKELSTSAGSGPPQETMDKVIGNVLGEEVRSEQEMESAPPISAVAIEASSSKKEGKPTRNDVITRVEPGNSFTPSRSTARPKKRKASTENIASAVMTEQAFSPKVSIEEDVTNSTLLQQYLDEQITTFKTSGEFVAEFNIIEEGKAEVVKVLTSIDISTDDKLKGLIESFKGWEGLGNKKVKILFK